MSELLEVADAGGFHSLSLVCSHSDMKERLSDQTITKVIQLNDLVALTL